MKNKWGPLNGGNLTPCRQLRYLFALSFHAARGEALPCCAMVGLSPIRSAFWRPAMQLSAAGECGAPWPCGLVVARPAGGGGCVAGARVVSFLPPAPQTLPRHACSAPPSRGLFAPSGRWRRLAGVRLTAQRLLNIVTQYRQPTPARIIDLSSFFY